MTLNKMEKSLIKGLMRENGWSALLKFVAMKTEQWQEQAITGTTAFEELRALHTRDGKVNGVKELFEEMERSALDV